jgi:Domain of unknown function (DUF4282)
MMTDYPSDQGRDSDWNHRSYASGEQYPDEQYPGEQYHGPGSPGSSRSSSGGSGYGNSAQGGSGYGSSGQGGSGYGSSGQSGSGYGSSGQGGGLGAARPTPGTPSQAGAAGPGMATAPIWQAAPGQGAQGQGIPGSNAPGSGAPGSGAPGQAAPGQAGFGSAMPPGGVQPMGPPTGQARAADGRGFLSALFDFSFTSFVTTRIIKVLYVLILVVVSLVALFYTIIAFRLSTGFGVLVLVIGDPLYIIIVMAFWRLLLEAFVVVFRIAEDVHAMRERGGR